MKGDVRTAPKSVPLKSIHANEPPFPVWSVAEAAPHPGVPEKTHPEPWTWSSVQQVGTVVPSKDSTIGAVKGSHKVVTVNGPAQGLTPFVPQSACTYKS